MRSWWWVKEKKKQMALVLIIVTMMILQFQMKGCVGCVETERMGLLQLKSYLNSLRSPEEESILDSWSDDDPQSDCCNWERVKCSDAIGGRIVDLSLGYIFVWNLDHVLNLDQTGRGLNLSLLHSFPQLKTLNFSNSMFDHLFDPIHGCKSFQRLENLESLDLSSNEFNSSVLPFISAARSLRILHLDYNRLEGVFPPNGFNNFRELEELDLSYNGIEDFKAGEGFQTKKLRTLDLSGNRFSDSARLKGYSKLCGLTNLRELDLRDNDLTSMPYCLGNLSRLRTLELSDNQLDGNLSAFVSGLQPELEYLSLSGNNFNGSFLFNSLVNHTRLTVFRLSSKVGTIQAQAESPWVPVFQLKVLVLRNFILGNTIPGFLLHQHDLSYVDLSHNKLTTGPFVRWLVQNNTRLQALSLNNNLLTELQLPRRVHHGLQFLDMSSNKIYGSIQEDIGIVFPEMVYMDFSSNQFHGTIPSSMGKMKGLVTLDMSSNGLSGQLPQTFLSGCYLLSFLKLSNNQFQGKIFPEHANLTSLSTLYLDGNNFSGCIGEGLLNSKELGMLDLSDNKLSGMVPLWMGRLSRIWYLSMRGNQLKGSFPHQLLSLKLKVMDISHNRFSGSIPSNVNFSSYPEELRLQNNHFMGSIPGTLLRVEGPKLLDLRNNNFSGKIPNTIGEMSTLRVLLLRNNSLESHIPEKICQLSEIGILDLSHNKFSGVIPSCLGNMSFGTQRYDDSESWKTNLLSPGIRFLQSWSYTSALYLTNDLEFGVAIIETVVDFLTKSRYEAYQGDILRYMYGLDLSSNRLSGEIPVEIGYLENIRCLNFSNNHLTGSIPYNFSKLKDVESLDLSKNNMYGNIPPVLAGLDSLGYFNVSYNNFSGEIPFKGHLLTFDERSYIGNAHLCGLPTNISCNPTRAPEASASTQDEEEEEDHVIDMEWFYWTCGAVYISTSLALLAFLCIDTRWSQEWFYRVDLSIHHLQRFKRSAFRN